MRIDVGDDEGREGLVRYCARPSFALERLSVLPDGHQHLGTPSSIGPAGGWTMLDGMETVARRPPSVDSPGPRRATLAQWLAIPEERRAELINGRIVYQGMPGPVHGRSQGKV